MNWINEAGMRWRLANWISCGALGYLSISVSELQRDLRAEIKSHRRSKDAIVMMEPIIRVVSGLNTEEFSSDEIGAIVRKSIEMCGEVERKLVLDMSISTAVGDQDAGVWTK